jgi:hypothetical protein
MTDADERRPERDDGDAALVASVAPDLLRHAFGAAIAAIVDRLPAGVERDCAIAEVMAAHERCAEWLARKRLH